MDFYTAIVSDPRFARNVGHVVAEFGASARQDVMDRYLAGETVTYEELRTVWTDTVGWVPTAGNTGFTMFFAAVRKANMELPSKDRIRVWLGEPPLDWSTATADDLMGAVGRRDAYPGEIIKQNILAAGQKALVIYGGAHFAGPVDDYEPMLAVVEAEYPDASFVILPYHQGHRPAACAPLLERAAAIWPAPALAAPAPGARADAAMDECATLDTIVDGDGVVFYGPWKSSHGRRVCRISGWTRTIAARSRGGSS